MPDSYNQEERILQSVAGNGLSVGFAPGLAFAHPGTTDENGDARADFRPHVANLTRNVVIRSELPTGSRGHVFLTYRSQIDIRYAAFVDLGRTTFEDLDPVTNHIGRYAVHLHHLMGPYPTVDPEYQYRLVGNVVRGSTAATPAQKWGFAIHDTHYGLLRDNVVYNVGGEAYVTEDGSESYNKKSGAPGSCPFCDLPDPDTVSRDNLFAPMAGLPLRTVSLDDESTDPMNEDRLFVCGHDGDPDDHFEVFFPSQGNAPCADTRPDVEGYVCVTPEVADVCVAFFADGFESGNTSNWSSTVP